MSNFEQITRVINELTQAYEQEDNALVLLTYNYWLGYLDCMVEYNLEDTKILKHIMNTVLKHKDD